MPKSGCYDIRSSILPRIGRAARRKRKRARMMVPRLLRVPGLLLLMGKRELRLLLVLMMRIEQVSRHRGHCERWRTQEELIGPGNRSCEEDGENTPTTNTISEPKHDPTVERRRYWSLRPTAKRVSNITKKSNYGCRLTRTMIRLFRTKALHRASNCFSPAL